MTSMTERVEQLEAHSQAFEAANLELDERNQQLALQLSDAVQQRDTMTANLEAERERMERLEGLAAQHVSRANALEQDLAATRADLAKVVELVRNCLGSGLT